MAINYNLDNRLNKLDALLDEYQGWFLDVMQGSLYQKDVPPMPRGIRRWLKSIDIDVFNIDGQYKKQEAALLSRLDQLAESFEALQNPPENENFLIFAKLFREFISNVHSLCHNIVLEEWGLDVLTGIKNITVVKPDLVIEMQRLSREGYPFCLALARIDNFAHIEKAMSEDEANDVIKTVAGMIQKSLRSYDDAYRVSRDHFIMCLKQSDIVGGQKGLERLRDVIEKTKETYKIDGEEYPLSISCCVSAPLGDDDIDVLIRDLYIDLDEQIKDSATVLTHQEMSPLQRFVQKEKG